MTTPTQPPAEAGPGGFDELIHAPTRLGIVALLAASSWAEFSFVRDSMGMSDSALSKQIATLEQAGYLQIRKQGAGRRRRTLVQLSAEGRRAFEAHAAALRALIDLAEHPTGQPTDQPDGAEPTPDVQPEAEAEVEAQVEGEAREPVGRRASS